MKKILCLAAGLFAFNLTPVFGQPVVAPQPMMPGGVPAPVPPVRFAPLGFGSQEQPALTKFNLDFPGGTAAELVAAIEKATGKPLNVIIASDEKTTKAKLPPVKVTDMDVARLFKSLERIEYERYNEIIYSRRFYTEDQQPKDNSLWTFSVYEKQTTQSQFSLDFPGGTPVQLVKAIEKAMGKPLNVIINKEDENIEIPPLKMKDVYLPQLFTALEAASRKLVAVDNNPGRLGFGNYSQFSAGYGFKTSDATSDSSVWYFHVEKPSVPPVISTPKVCQYYSLSPYLDHGFTVDDITTAIQTGWKMAGETSPPELNYHKETGLLIAFGEPSQLKTINDVLGTLPQLKSSYWQDMNKNIFQLQQQVRQLQQKISVPATNAAPAEKSGK